MAEIFRDEFLTATDVELSAHSPDVGTSWQKILAFINNAEESPLTAASDIGLEADNDTLSGGSTATGGGLSDGSLYQANATYPTANIEASIVMTAQGGSDDPVWLAVRIVDKDNFYGVRIIGGGTNTCQIYKKGGGIWSALGAAFNGPADGVTVKLKAEGTAISVEFNGVQQRTVTDSDLSSGKAGIGMGHIGASAGDDMSSSVDVDTFVVNTLSQTKTFTVDGLVKEVKTKTFTMDGIVKASNTKTFTMDGLVATRATKTFTMDGVVAQTNTKLFTVDGLVKETKTKTFTADGVVIDVGQTLFTIDAVVQITNVAKYILEDINLPRPEYMVRETIVDWQYYEMLDGTTKRDIINNREKIILTWKNLDRIEADTIVGLAYTDGLVTFSLIDGNLIVAEKEYHVEVLEYVNQEKGSDYRSNLSIQLIEAD